MEEMLALYGYTGPSSEKDTGRMAAGLPNMTLDKVRSNHGDADGSQAFCSFTDLLCCVSRIRCLRICLLGGRKKTHLWMI